MDDFKGVVKIDFKEAREKSGFTEAGINDVFKSLNYNFTAGDVESGKVKITPEQADTFMGICGINQADKAQYYAKYTTIGKTQF